MFVHLVYSVEGWELVRAVAQWQGTGMVNQRPWVRLAAAPPFFPALSPFFNSPWAAMAYDWVFN